jgi:hypothetical protein
VMGRKVKLFRECAFVIRIFLCDLEERKGIILFGLVLIKTYL